MLQTRSGLSRPVLKWVSQVAASLGATLAATAIWSAMPHAGSAPQADLTSGGKFAARAVEAVAYDGLDAMPRPRVVADPGAAARWSAPALIRTAWEVAPAELPGRSTRAARLPHAAAGAEPRRPAPAGQPSRPAATPADLAGPAEDAWVGTRALGSVVSPVTSAARAAWDYTATAGDIVAATAGTAWRYTASTGVAVASRVVPGMP